MRSISGLVARMPVQIYTAQIRKPGPFAQKSQILRRPRNLGQMIAIQILQYFPQPLVTVILLIPLILMIYDLSLLVERQGDQTVDLLTKVEEARRIFLALLVDDGAGCVFDDLGCERLG